MSAPVFVAGKGVISAIGNDTAACITALENGIAGIGDMAILDSVHSHELPVAEVKLTNEELATLTGMSSRFSRTALLSAMAAFEARKDAGIEDFSRWRTGFISANTVGGMDKTENFFADFLSHHQKGQLRNIVHHECGGNRAGRR